MSEERACPLTDVSVVELAGIGPAPFAGMMLRQLGAQITRVERPSGLDSVIPVDRDPINFGKSSVQCDLKSAAGVAQVYDLVADADVLIEGYRPGVLERLGLDPARLLARNPRLVIGRMTGWGQEGPFAKAAGHDLNYISITGALHAIGAADGPPQIPLNLVGDYGGGALYLVVGILAALHEAARTGQGQVVDAAIVDGTAHLLSGVHAAMAVDLWHDRRGVNFMDGGSPYYAVYRTSDGEYMAVSAVEAPFYRSFVELLGLAPLALDREDPANWPQLRVQFAEMFGSRTQAEWTAIFDGSDACVTPVLGLRASVDHPHIAARKTLMEIDGRVCAAPAPRFLRPGRIAILEEQ